jgi:hypothetical protein
MLAKRHLIKFINFWPPLLGAGIRLKYASPDLRELEVVMKLSRLNTNYVGTHYGGSLYSMTDPWYMLMLIENLGKDYVVWDKSADIRFRRPGTGVVRAHFKIEQELLDAIKADVASQGKTERTLPVRVLSADGTVVAEVNKVLWIGAKKLK